MKFGKEFVSQMVPEWQEAYMDYNSLKALLKELLIFKQKTNKPVASRSNATLIRNLTLYRTFSGLTQRSHHQRSSSNDDIENGRVADIVVNNVKRDNESVEGPVETTFLVEADDEGARERELGYFKKLDNEFNKVLKFYKSKVDDVMQEASVLNKQMDALIAFRVRVEHPKGWMNYSSLEEIRQVPINEENSRNGTGNSDESSDDDGTTEGKEINQENYKTNDTRAKKPAHLEALKNVKFNTIRGFLHLSDQTELKFSKDNLKKAEEQLKKAFIKFYRKLRTLKSYSSFLNILAFSKIMKKYDKIASRRASKPYMKMVDHSYLGRSDEVSKLMERVEVTFIKHFSNSNRSKGMGILRPKGKREKHRVTFYMGFLVGCTFALILALALIIHARKMLNQEGRMLYMDTMFPLYSLFGFAVLHMIMYAGNIYFWRRYRVNYSFIFGFEEGTELGHNEVLLVGFCLSALALASVLANLDMEMDPVTRAYEAVTELVPLVLVGLVVVIMLCPLNIIYRSSRYFLLVCLFHCILAPLYKVSLPDFWLADQLTSQVQALRSLEFYVCYYGSGDYKSKKNSCRSNQLFITVSFVVADIPYWWRLLQCLRRLFEEGDVVQGYNSLKYSLTIVAVSTRTGYIIDGGVVWKFVAFATSILATVFSVYWDIVQDWGLLQSNSKNRWLRDKLLVPHKSVYFVAMVLDCLLRLAWVQTVTGVTIFSFHTQAMLALVASLEIIRRGIWNFFRLENEHLNNVGKYRAFKSVPLPFNYDEDEDKDE